MSNPDIFGQSIDDIIGILKNEQSNLPPKEETKDSDILNQFSRQQTPNIGQDKSDSFIKQPPMMLRHPNSAKNEDRPTGTTRAYSTSVSKENSDTDFDSLMQFCNQFEKPSSGVQQKSGLFSGTGSAEQNKRQQTEITNSTSDTFSMFSKTQIRYLQFKPWSGILKQQVKDTGYYYKFTNGPVKLILGLLEDNGFKETIDQDWTISWCVGPVKMEIYQSMMAYQRINHFPKSFEITRQDLMHRNISKMQIRFGFANFNFVPKTYILPAENQLLLEDYEQNGKTQVWYISQPASSSQGQGIFVTDQVQEILKQPNPNGNVVSHYIANPLLINDLQFDLRVYVAITSINPLRIYVYQDGLTRFATHAYSVDNLNKGDRFVHLTNYSVNQDSENFVVNQDANDDFTGSKWSLQALKDYLKINNVNSDLIFERMDDLIIQTIISSQNMIYSAFEMNVPYTNNCFEVLGFDVLIDSNLQPWLLEVNLSPSMNTDSPLDLKIKGEMISDLFSMVGIVPLDQRYTIDTSYAHTANSILSDKQVSNKILRINNWQTYKKDLSRQQRYIIKQSDDQLKRARKFKRIFPTQNAFKYQNYFDVDRPYNILMRNYELDQFKSNQNINVQSYHKVSNPSPLSHQPNLGNMMSLSSNSNTNGLNNSFNQANSNGSYSLIQTQGQNPKPPLKPYNPITQKL